MSKYGLQGKLKATPGNGEKLGEILLQASKLVSATKGCRMYIISTVKDEKDCFRITEFWDSKEDHDNSLKTEGVADLVLQALPILEGQPKRGRELDVLGGFGL
ncbi:putative quinol monooxygenase [Pedobacter sp. MC2016-24]|jgi:quinol monooxygenase YgiN|uniref:putative quinol monooxygenase n=1 Tax=Pedobacter sp. MC2016-24 TaxID=2780090 RepID=UPI001882136C|nr:antibiotic biosynthesis monooxygenase [Pedobacter sp. MC2016-24]MBE9602006.1 antibiotic biosynthesis monooxygenase [Pedobacter sp. MC2016-24]